MPVDFTKKAISCGALVCRKFNDVEQVLLVKQKPTSVSWGIPKGHIKRGESFEECALREVLEETGIEIELTKRLRDCYKVSRFEEKTIVVFLAVPTSQFLTTESCPTFDDVFDAQWKSMQDLPPLHGYQEWLTQEARKYFKSFTR